MDVRVLEYLIAMEEEGNLSRAAQKVHVTQSALSQCLQKTEKELGYPLFLRVDRRLVPTNVGRIYLDGAREMVDVKEKLYKKIEQMVSNSKPQLRIAADPQIYFHLMESWIPQLQNQYPDVRFKVFSADSSAVKQYLLNNVADAGFFCIRHSDNALLNLYPVYEETLVLAVPLSLLPDETNSLLLETCRSLPFILPKSGTFFRPFIQDILDEAGITPQSMYEAEDFQGMKKLMELGYGITFLPSRMVDPSPCFQSGPLKNSARYQIAFALLRYTETPQELKSLMEFCLGSEDGGTRL